MGVLRVPWMFLRRLRVERGSALAVAALVLVTAFLFGLAPRLLATTADDVLHTTVARNPVAARSLAFAEQARIQPGTTDAPLARVDDEGEGLQQAIPEPLRSTITDRVSVVDTTRWSVVSALPIQSILTIRFEPRAFDHVRLVAGRLPAPSARTVVVPATGTDPELRAPVYEIVVADAVASKLALRPGETLLLRPDRRDPPVANLPVAAAADVVGIYAVTNPADDFWFGEPALLHPTVRAISSEVQFLDVFGLAAPAAYPAFVDATRDGRMPLRYSWRLTVDPARIDAASTGAVQLAIRRLESMLPASGYGTGGAIVSTSLLSILGDEDAQWQSAVAVLATMATGPAAIATAAFALVAAMTARRRRTTAHLWRARGASRLQLFVAALGETFLLVVPAAVAAGAAATALVPLTNGTPTRIAVAAVGVVAALLVLATVLPAGVGATGTRAGTAPGGADRAVTASRFDLTGRRRAVLEAVLVAVAVGAVWLLRERSVHGTGGAGAVGIDPLVAVAPALAGIAAGLVAMRIAPLPMALLARAASTGRGLVGVLGLRRATRGGAGTAVLLVLLATSMIGAFSSAALVQLERSSTEIAWHDVGAPFRIAVRAGVLGPNLDPTAAGAEAVAVGHRTVVNAGSIGVAAQLLAIDPAAYSSVVAGLPVEAEAALPAELSAAPSARPGDPIPAIVSTSFTEARGGVAPDSTFSLVVDGRPTSVRAVAVRAAYPTLDPGTPFVVVSKPQLEAARGSSLGTTDLFIRAPDSAAAPLRSLVEQGSAGASVTSRTETSAALAGSPITQAVRTGVLAAAVVAGAYAALAVVAALALAAAARTNETGVLRTFGLSRRDALGLIVSEHGPIVAFAFAAGAVMGVALFVAMRPGLGLAGVVGSELDVGVSIDPVQLLALLAFVVVVAGSGIAFGLALERRGVLATVVRRGVE